MVTRVVAVGELTGIEEMEKRLVELVEQVEREKEKMRDTFQQFRNLLVIREEALLWELEGVVVEARQELKGKREVLEELRAAKESSERKLTKNKVKKILEKHLQNIENQIQEELSKSLNVTWVKLEWKREQLEQSISEVSRVVRLKEGPFRTVDYSLKLRPVWYHEGTGSRVIEDPHQLAIDTISGNIFVVDWSTQKIQVFDNTGHYLYHIPTSLYPIGLCLSDEFIFVSTGQQKLLKIQISTKKTIKSVATKNMVYGMDISTNIYVCETRNISVIVFDPKLNFLKRIPLKSPLPSSTFTNSIRLYQNNMYVMFAVCDSRLQVFSLDGQLIRNVIPLSDIKHSFYFSIDQSGNIIVADYSGVIKIFSNSGYLIHTISNDMLTEDQKFSYPTGISVDKQNNIVVAQDNKKCNLIAF